MATGEPVPALAEEVVAWAQRSLGQDLVGACLHGSAVAGGLRPDSDVDVLLLLARSLTSVERQELVSELLVISGHGGNRGGRRRGPDRPPGATTWRCC